MPKKTTKKVTSKPKKEVKKKTVKPPQVTKLKEQTKPEQLKTAHLKSEKLLPGRPPIDEKAIKEAAKKQREALTAILDTVLPSQDKREVFLSLYEKHKGNIEELFKAKDFRKDNIFKKYTEDLKFTLQLWTLFQHVPLIHELQKKRMEKNSTIKSLRDLAQYNKHDWNGIIKKIELPADTPGRGKERYDNFAKAIAANVEKTFPTETIAYRIQKDEDAKSEIKSFFRAILSKQVVFDMLTTPIQVFLKKNPDMLKNIPEDRKKHAIAELKSIQRVRKLTSNYEQMQKVRKFAPHGQAIIDMGQNAFMKTCKENRMGEEEALEIYSNAVHVHNAALVLFAEHSPAFHSAMPYAISGDLTSRRALTVTAEEADPEWRTLFGSIDFCDCKHCQSVYSPSAYLVDILKFLARGTSKEGRTPLEVLLQRRPDIQHIELTCENTNITLPYIDIVNEVLENAITPPHFRIDPEFQADLENKIISPRLQHVFSENNVSLSSTAKVYEEDHLFWRISDRSWHYIIFPFIPRLGPDSGIITHLNVFAYPQTGSTTKELNANPEQFNPLAYDKIREAIYPWNLPLDLWVEEARLYLDHLGVHRYELMETFFEGDPSNVLIDPGVAREYIGLIERESAIITGKETGKIWELWGLSEIDNDIADPADGRAPNATGKWNEVLKRVSIFLKQSDLKYAELLELLDTYFINPYDVAPRMKDNGRLLSIISTETDSSGNLIADSCNLSKLEINNLNGTALKRICYFVRLCKKLDWSMQELDRALFALKWIRPEDSFYRLMDELAKSAGTLLEEKLDDPNNDFGVAAKKLTENIVQLPKRIAPSLKSAFIDHIKTMVKIAKTLFKKEEIKPNELFGKKIMTLEVLISEILGIPESDLDNKSKKNLEEFIKIIRNIGTQGKGIQVGLIVELVNLIRELECSLSEQISTSAVGVSLRQLLHLLKDFQRSTDLMLREIGLGEDFLFRLHRLLLSMEIYHKSDTFKDLMAVLQDMRLANEVLSLLIQSSEQAKSKLKEITHQIQELSQSCDDLLNYIGLPEGVLMRIARLDKTLENIEPQIICLITLIGNLRLSEKEVIGWSGGGYGKEFQEDLLTAIHNFDKTIGELVGTAGFSEKSLTALVELKIMIDDLCKRQLAEISAANVLAFNRLTCYLLRFWHEIMKIRRGNRYDLLKKAVFERMAIFSKVVIELLMSVGVDIDMLIKLSHIQRLHRNLNVPIPVILSWYAHLDTAEYHDGNGKKQPSLFKQLFLNPSVIKRDPGEEDPFELNHSRSGLKIAGKSLLDINIKSCLLAALSISESDLSLLINGKSSGDDDFGPTVLAAVLESDKLTLENLSILYRHTSFARALKLSIQDILVIKTLSDIIPFAPGGFGLTPTATADTIKFVEIIKKIRPSGFTALELDYLLRHQATSHSGVAPSEESTGVFLRDLWNGLRTITAENSLPPDPNRELNPDPNGEITKKKFEVLKTLTEWQDSDIEKAMNLLAGSITYSTGLDALPDLTFPDPINKRVSYDGRKTCLIFNGLMTEAEKQILLDLSDNRNYKTAIDFLFNDAKRDFAAFADKKMILFLDPKEVVTNFVGNPQWSTKEKRFYYMLNSLLAYLRKVLSESFVTQKLAEALALEITSVEQMICKWISAVDDNSKEALSVFLDLANVSRSDETAPVKPEETGFSTAFEQFILLRKIALIITKLRIPKTLISWIFESGYKEGMLNFNALPISEIPAGETDKNLLAGFERLFDLCNLIDKLPSGEALAQVLTLACDSKTTYDVFLKALNKLIGWHYQELEVLSGAEGFSLKFPDDYKDEKSLRRLMACFNKMKRLGVSASQCFEWSKPILDVNDARSIKQAVKAKYSDERWLDIAKPLSDLLREKRRDALVAFLISKSRDYCQQGGWKDANELYEYFLIDTEMSPCMMTSRTKQAINSVQLFIQRCLMNLERDVLLTEDEAKEWKQWRKQYRIWEANRKIFLYPENWIEPELRDDKSPFFKDLEHELLQNEITHATAETAFTNYIEKLDKVARLEICGMYHQREDNSDINVLYVFARSSCTPHTYYFRKQIRSSINSSFYWTDCAYWTPWEKIDLDIEGNHLLPIIWNGRLYLFWPIIVEKPYKGKQPQSQQASYTSWEIKIAWSEYKNTKWIDKKTSKDVINTFWHLKCGNEKRCKFCEREQNITECNVMNFLPLQKFIFLEKHLNDDLYIEIHWLDPENNEERIMNWWRSVRFRGSHEAPEISQTAWNYYSDKANIEFMTVVDNDSLKFSIGNTEIILINVNNISGIYPTEYRVHPLEFPETRIDYKPFFFADNKRTFLVLRDYHRQQYHFQTFYHPYVSLFIHELNHGGIESLLRREIQMKPEIFLTEAFDFEKTYLENIQKDKRVISHPYPTEEIDFSGSGSYAQYNWELFFHGPLLIADRLSKNQRFEEAQKWFHYIFDPASNEVGGAERFWKLKPFHEATKEGEIRTLEELMRESEEINSQVAQWEKNPFKPHVIARLRIVSYMKNVVMKYIDNLVAWGDQLFRRDTIESINEATQLYVLAAQILGKRPERIPARAKPQTQTFHSITQKSELDPFSNALVEIENFIFPSIAPRTTSKPLQMQYFCLPENDKLLGYWATVEDRLFKIRHCMNIEGVVRQLPLFEPPIEPGLLVKAAAAGIDISSALNDINAALPPYRFNIMVQKATELCAEVKALGAALLSALEKRDAEALSLLRSNHELRILEAIRNLRKHQIDQANNELEGLRQSKQLIEIRRDYYRDICKISDQEQFHMESLCSAHKYNEIAQGLSVGVSLAHMLPDFHEGAAGICSPYVVLKWGGTNLGPALQAAAGVMSMIAALHSHKATMASVKGGYDRRWDDWKLQERLATKELEQIDKQIAAAEIRKAIAERELGNHELQIENAKEADEYLRRKFNNKELYDWMVGQISSVYFESYQLAYDVCKRAERAYRFELGLQDSNFIQFGYWDNLKKGLLAGEKLYHDLKRMEVSYLDQNKRDYEITKHISLAVLDPTALLKLKENGECFVDLPEALFDLDYPGHYIRRIKSVSLTIPCVIGPYASVNCTLILLSNRIRRETRTSDGYAWKDENDPRFSYNVGAIESIATSSAQNDSGMFELNFRDERYLPFEGAGVISSWHIELSKQFRSFDYDTISDVVIHLKYTAREGGDTLKNDVIKELNNTINEMALAESRKGLFRLFSIKHEFSNEWHKFLRPTNDSTNQSLQLDLSKERFPFQFRDKKILINESSFYLKLKEGIESENKPLVLDVKKQKSDITYESPDSVQCQRAGYPFQGFLFGKFENRQEEITKWSIEINREKKDKEEENAIPAFLRFKIKEGTSEKDEVVRIDGKDCYRLNPDVVEDFYLACQYSIKEKGVR